jgi:phage tail sheath protein FI
MPQYLAPGVYVEEVPSSVQPIAGVGTSTAGFIGEVDDAVVMPMQPGKFVSDSLGVPVKDSLGNVTPIPFDVAEAGVPQLITSWESFKNRFGDFQDGNRTLAHAVYGFFNNGGTRCWVARTDAPLDVTSVRAALALFAGIDEIALVAVPGAGDSDIHAEVIAHCENVGDRFGILDAPEGDDFDPDVIKGDTANSTYAAMYYPRIEVFDPVDNARAFVAPSGHICGIFARIDTERGVHKAPANAVVRGAVGLEHRLSRADQAGLNPDGINVIRELNGSIVLWGARTLGGDANGEWKYINVRRLFLFLRESIDEGTQWVVFEPNDTALWAKISRNVTAFLTNVWRSGALFGTTPAEAFYVRCDASTNPPEVRDLGQVVCEIGVAVVRPAEFVIFRISQWAGPGK